MELSRRNILRNTAASAALTTATAFKSMSANSKAQIGMIGTGGRGRYLTERAYAGVPGQMDVAAICDTFTGNLARGKDLVATKGGASPKTYADYKELLADKSIDAVVIATPEHLHFRMLMDAIAAGKHVYLEKPLAHTVEEAQEIKKALAKTDRIVQVGTQNRSNSLYQKAKQMIQEGMIGECHYVRAFWYRNALPDGSGAWRYAVPADATEQNTDWKRFLGPARTRAFNKNRYFQWRLYWDYSNGIATDLMVHQTDVTAYVVGKGIPHEVMANGGVYRWTKNDDREVPDTISCLLDYPPDKFHINYSCYLGNSRQGYGEQFMGDEGTIEVISRSTLNFYPEAYPGVPGHIKARKEFTQTIPNNDNLAVESHIRNWLAAIRGEEKVIAPINAGFEAAITGFLSTVSLRSGRKVKWDHKTDKYTLA
jgi:predicted dehydrogenase